MITLQAGHIKWQGVPWKKLKPTLCVITLKVMFEQHVQGKNRWQRHQKGSWYFAGLYQATVNYSHKAHCYVLTN